MLTRSPGPRRAMRSRASGDLRLRQRTPWPVTP